MAQDSFLRKKPKSGSTQQLYAFFIRFMLFVVLFIGFWSATQYFAQLVSFDPRIIGEPFHLTQNGYPLYFPWMYFSWLIDNLKYPLMLSLFRRALTPLLVICSSCVVLYIVLSVFRGLNQRAQDVFASSRMAEKKDLKKSGMLSGKGIPLCQTEKAKIKIKSNSGDVSLSTKKRAQIVNTTAKSHIFVCAPPRSYKGVSVLLPTLLQYMHSVFVVDFKGELYEQTSGWRRKFSRIILFAPGSEVSCGFNFLMAIRPGDDAWTDAMMLATTMLAPKTEGREDENAAHFRVAATMFLAGIVLHILCGTAEDKSLGGCLDFLTLANCGNDEESGDKSVELLQEMINTEHCNANIHQKIVACANAQLTRPSRERGSVTSTVLKALSIFMDNRVRRNTTRHDFSYQDFIESSVPLSLYMSISNAKIDQLDVIIKLFVTMFLRRITDGETSHDNVAVKNELLFVIDEFHALGAFNFIQKAMAIVPGYGIRFLLVCQSFSQIESVYGREHQFMALCKHIVIFAPGDFATAKHFSEVIGKDSIWKTSVSTSGNRGDVVLQNLNQSGSEVERSVITADELMRLPFNKCLVFTQGGFPYLGCKIISYDDVRYKYKLYNAKNRKEELAPLRTLKEVLQECAPLSIVQENPWYTLPLHMFLEKYEDILFSEELIDPWFVAHNLAEVALSQEETPKTSFNISDLLVGV